jgi:hypothetical protein
MIRQNFLGRALLTCMMAGCLAMAVGTTPIRAARNDNDGQYDHYRDVQQH